MAKLVLFSGAGLSAESGLATFRGAGGLWNGHDVRRVCDMTTFKANRGDALAFYDARRAELARVEPNAAHRAFAAWERRHETVNLTTNCDDLLERAGCVDVVHLHGSLTRMECLACGGSWEVGMSPWAADARCAAGKRHCTSVNAVKPAVVFFNQAAPLYAILYRTLRNLRRDDIVVVVGSSSEVVQIDSLLADRPGYKVRVNPHALPFGHETYDEEITATATEAVQQLDALLAERLRPKAERGAA